MDRAWRWRRSTLPWVLARRMDAGPVNRFMTFQEIRESRRCPGIIDQKIVAVVVIPEVEFDPGQHLKHGPADVQGADADGIVHLPQFRPEVRASCSSCSTGTAKVGTDTAFQSGSARVKGRPGTDVDQDAPAPFCLLQALDHVPEHPDIFQKLALEGRTSPLGRSPFPQSSWPAPRRNWPRS